MTQYSFSTQDTDRVLGVLLGSLERHGFTRARFIVTKAGITGITVTKQYWQPFLSEVDRAFHEFEPATQQTILRVLADELASDEEVRALLGKHGFEYINGTFVPVEFFDQREARFLLPSSASELAKAIQRLVDGDESGAITSACGAVDIMTQQLYVKYGFGDPGKVAFAAKVMTAADNLNLFSEMETELVAIGISPQNASQITADMRGAMNHASQMLQALRRTMGDVHGSKPAFRRAAYDAIKWASAICGLFTGR